MASPGMTGWRVLALLALAAACAYALFAWAYQPAHLVYRVQKISGSTLMAMEARSSYQSALQARANLEALAALEDECRVEIRCYLLQAENERILGRNEAALATYQRALRVEPRTEVYVSMATLLAELGRFDEAADAFATAVRFSPTVQQDVDRYGEELGRNVRERLARGKATVR
jgi:tetratricopeptide (TPR) repeat protein